MARKVLGVIAGFIIWSILWLGSEKALSAISPQWLGAHQAAFEAAVEKGGAFTADSTILAISLVRGAIVSVISGYLTVLITRENKRTPLILGVLLVAFGLFVVAMSWSHIPVWYHIIFTALLIPMTMVGAKLAKVA